MEFKTAYTVRLNGEGKGSIEYINEPCEQEKEQEKEQNEQANRKYLL